MPDLQEFIPEIASAIMGFILGLLGVPSVADVGIMILEALQTAVPEPHAYSIAGTYIIVLRILGWFATFEVVLRIIMWFSQRESSSGVS